MSHSSHDNNNAAPDESLKFFDKKDNFHTVIFAPTRTGMSGHYAELSLTDDECSKIIASSPQR